MNKLKLLIIVLFMAGCELMPPQQGEIYVDDNPISKDTVKVLYLKNQYVVFTKNADTISMRRYMFTANYHKITQP